MTIAAVRAAIGTTLSGISSLGSVHNQVPEAMPKLPATIAQLERVRYHETLDGCITQEWRVLLLLYESDSKKSHDDLDPYLAVSGDDSIKAAIEAGSIGDSATVTFAETIGFVEYRNRTFIGAEILIEIVETA